ncbi:MAG: TonB-dependent receptor [Acidobacteriota bacterium]|nr:TonB-dependent receptor [Acidobacteriota bacterium]
MQTVRTWALTLTVLLAPAVAAAQSGSATVAGTLRDASGAVLPGVRLELRNPDTGQHRAATSGAAGQYEFGGLSPASMLTVVTSLDGFRPVERAVTDLAAGERRLIDLRLQIAAAGERVDVRADTSLGRSASPALGGGLPRAQVDRLPVNGRDLLSLAYLIPGAAPARGFYNLAPRLTINGASSLVTNYSVDGFDNTDLFLGGSKVATSIGSTEQLKVLVNSYTTEYGRTGNGVFAVTTRSGSNTRRGELFYTVRPGAALDSPNFFAPRDRDGEIIDDSFGRHQTGGWTGGPIRSDRVFYFADVEVTREREDAILTSPLAAGLAPTALDRQTALGKVDTRWSDRHSTTIRYQFSNETYDGSRGFVGGLTLPSAGLEVNYRNHFGSVTHRTIGATWFNEAGLQTGQLRSDWRSPDAGPRVIVTDRGATLAVLGSVSDNFFWTESDLQIRNVFTRLAGRHTLKIGGDLLRADFLIDSGPGARGAYVVDLEGRAVTPAGAFVTRDDLPRDVRVLSYSQSFGNPEVDETQWLAGLFAEDTFRVTPDVTLTLGIRWDYDSVTDTPVGDGDRNNLAPRLGVSWTPRGSARHQLRGGYGIFYERIPFAVYSDTRFNRSDGGSVSVTFAPGTPFSPPVFPSTFPAGTIDTLPLPQLPPRNVQVFDPQLRSPWTAQTSAGYVFAVTDNLTIAVDYVHGRGHNLIRRVDTNAPASVAPGVTRSVADADATRPIVPAAGGFRLIEVDEASGRSIYDGLYVNARRRLNARVAFDVAYTLSRIRNNTDDINFRPVDSRRPDDELGPSLNDRRHVLAVNGLVRAPLGVDVVPVLFLSSGQPLTVTTGRDDNGDTIFNDRPAGFSRNSERTAGFAQVDLGLIRRFAIGRAAVEARASVFNLLNRTNFSGFFNYGASGVRPDEQGTLAFQPTQAGPSRQFQFTVRVIF